MLDYAFGRLERHRVEAETKKRNERSWLLMERLGMRREAHVRERVLDKGEWQDVFVYAILKSVWASGGTPAGP